VQDKPPFRKPIDAEFAEAAKQTKANRYARLRPQGGRVAALHKLHEQLADDAGLYESNELQDQRDSVAHALLAVVDYLIAQGFAHSTVAPLMRPVVALAERENNSLDLMFAQRARAGRPKATLADHERTGMLAALAEEWLRTRESDDRPQSDKLADAARKLRGRWFGTVSRAQLETARELVSQEAPDHPAVNAARLYRGWIASNAEMFGVENAIPIMVRMLNDSELPFGAGEGGILKTPNVSPTD
jgi:hypothetical protein